jgi:membrane glycosyltransferase
MSGVPPIGAPDLEAGAGPESKRPALRDRLLTPKTVTGTLVAALTVWFVLANNTHTRIHLWVVWVSARLWIVLAVMFVAGALAGFLLGRRGKDRRRRDRDDRD